MIAVFGEPPRDLVEVPAGAVQTADLIPGSADLAEMADGALDRLIVLAPPGAVERRYVLAQGLRALKPGGAFVVMAPKDRGGQRLAKELTAFGCEFVQDARRHHRICTGSRPASPDLADALAQGAPRQLEGLGWTQPGVFHWDRIDPGTAMLIEALPDLAGQGADFGCGIGILGQRVLAGSSVTALSLIDLDRRAVRSAERNLADPRARFLWADVRSAGLKDLDFVVMNPPFHDGGREDRALGQAFIGSAARALKKGGACWLVANRHLPYEAVLHEHFLEVRLKKETGAFKVYEALR